MTSMDELLDIDLAWDAYPPYSVLVEAIRRFTQHRQPFKVFYHAIRGHVHQILRSPGRSGDRRGATSSSQSAPRVRRKHP